MALSSDEVRRLARLLDEALELPADLLESWIQALPAREQPLIPHLRQMMSGAATNSRPMPLLPRQGLESGEASGGDHRARGAPVIEPGDRIGPYRAIRVIGRGRAGTVWLGERADGLSRRQVAIKLPHLHGNGGSRLGERLARLRQIGTVLEHPNIAGLLDAGFDESAGGAFLVMELVQGHGILAHGRERRLRGAQRLRLMLQVCTAVAHAHRHLVVHGGIRPSKLVVDGGLAKVLDFGTAQLRGTDEGMASSSDADDDGYSAPEQRSGGALSAATDIYALGVVAHELLTGELPRPARDGAREPAARLPADLRAVLAMAMRADPDERYSSADRFADDLQRVLDHRPVAAAPAGIGHRARLFARRQRGPLLVVAALSALALAAAFWGGRMPGGV